MNITACFKKNPFLTAVMLQQPDLCAASHSQAIFRNDGVSDLNFAIVSLSNLGMYSLHIFFFFFCFIRLLILVFGLFTVLIASFFDLSMQGMYSCCQIEDETVQSGHKSSLPQYHTMTTMPAASQQHLVTATINNATAITMVQQQQQQKHHQQQGQTYTTMLPGSPPTTGHSAMALGPSNSPLLEGPMPCSTFLPRHDRRLAVVDRWNRQKPEKVLSGGSSGSLGVGGITGGISELHAQQQYQQNVGPHWSLQGGGPAGGVDTGLDEYKRYYGPIDPEGLGTNSDQQAGPQQTPKANPRGTKPTGIPHLPPKGPQQGPGHLIAKPPPPIPSFPRRPPFWRRGSLVQARRKGSGGPLYENVLPLGRRGGGRYGPSDGVGRRGRRPPPPPLPIQLSSPTHTPTTPSSPCHFYSTCSSASSSSSSSTSSSSSSSSSASLSRSNSPSSCSTDSSYNSSLSFRYRAGDRDFMVDEDYDSDLLTEESSLLLGSRRKIRSRRMSSRSLPCSPPPPPIPPRKPRPQKGYGRERTGSQLAQLQEWWASWGDREQGRRESSKGEGEMSREEKRHNKEREHERKRRKKGRKKKKREDRERERERKRRKTKKKRKKEDKMRKRDSKRSEQIGGDVEKREELKPGTADFPPYPPLRRESFRKKSESSVRSYGWNIPGDEERKERDEKERGDGEDSRGKERHYRRRNSKHYPSSSNKPPSSVKFWGGGNPSSDTIPSAFLPLLPVSSKRRKSKSSDKDTVGVEGERRPLLGRNGRGEIHPKEGLSFHEWESEFEREEVESEIERRKMEHGKRHRGGRTESDEERECDKVVGIYSDDDGSSGEFGKFERYWEDHEGRAIGGIGGGGWFFSTYPSSRDDLFLERGERWGTAESGWGSSGGGGGRGERGERGWGSGSHWPPPPLTPPPPRRYWSVDKLHIQDEKKIKRKSKDKGRGHTACSSCHSPRHHAHSHSSKWARVTSRSQEELYQHCQSFGGPLKLKLDSLCSTKPDRSQNPSKSGSQSNLSIQQRSQRTDRDRDRGRQSSPPPSLIPNLPPPLPALPAPPSSSHPIHVPPPTSSSSVSSPSVVSSTPGAPQPSSMAAASAKLQYQRLRSVPQPQRFPQSPHLPLKTKSLCSRRGSAHFSSVESEV